MESFRQNFMTSIHGFKYLWTISPSKINTTDNETPTTLLVLITIDPAIQGPFEFMEVEDVSFDSTALIDECSTKWTYVTSFLWT